MSRIRRHVVRSIVRVSDQEASRPDHPARLLRTRFLPLPRRDAWLHLQACVEGLTGNGGGWKLDEETPASGQFRLVRHGRLGWLVCDVTVSMWPADERRFAVDVASASRGGRLDFGQNGRNIRDFYRALEATLQRLPANGTSAASLECDVRNAERKNMEPAASERTEKPEITTEARRPPSKRTKSRPARKAG